MMQEGQQGNEAFCEVGRGLIPGVTDRLPECTPRRLKDGGEAMTQSLRSGPSVDIGARHINPARRWAVHLNTGNLVFVNTNQLVPDGVARRIDRRVNRRTVSPPLGPAVLGTMAPSQLCCRPPVPWEALLRAERDCGGAHLADGRHARGDHNPYRHRREPPMNICPAWLLGATAARAATGASSSASGAAGSIGVTPGVSGLRVFHAYSLEGLNGRGMDSLPPASFLITRQLRLRFIGYADGASQSGDGPRAQAPRPVRSPSG